MTDAKKLLEKQARWQRSRKKLSWEEKIRIAEAVREDVAKWRAASAKHTSIKARGKRASRSRS